MQTTIKTPKSLFKANYWALLLLFTIGFSAMVEMAFPLLSQIDAIELVDTMDGELELDEKKEAEKKCYENDQLPINSVIEERRNYTMESFDFPDSISLERNTPPPRLL